MKPTEEQLTQWIDGTLSHEETREVDAWLAANPQDRHELEEMRAISREIAVVAAPPADLPAAEFFTHQLERRLDELDQPVSQVAALASPKVVPWMRYFASSLAAAAVAVFATVITLRLADDADDGLAVVEQVGSDLTGIYTPQESVKVDAFYSDGADAQVVILDGLPEVAAEVRIAGFGEARQKSFYEATFAPKIEKMMAFVDAKTSDVH